MESPQSTYSGREKIEITWNPVTVAQRNIDNDSDVAMSSAAGISMPYTQRRESIPQIIDHIFPTEHSKNAIAKCKNDPLREKIVPRGISLQYTGFMK